MNYLLYSDLHIRPETHEVCDHVLSEIGILAEKHDATIINGGDTHNTRGLIVTSSHDILTKHYMKWLERGLNQIILIGNHDQEDRVGEIHPMRGFSTYEGWHVVDEPTVIDGIAFLPYMHKDRIPEALRKIKKVDTAIVHWGIMGAKRNDWNTDTDGIPVEWLARFKRVFSGHYHFRNQFENVQYIGSPYQQNHSESNQPKGVILYDKDSNKSTFHEIKDTPKYWQVGYTINDKGDVEIEGEISNIKKGDHVSVKVEGDSELVNAVTHDTVKKYFDCDSVKFNRLGRVKSHSRLGITSSEALTPLLLMQKYTEFVDTSLDRKRLMDIGGELINELHS